MNTTIEASSNLSSQTSPKTLPATFEGAGPPEPNVAQQRSLDLWRQFDKVPQYLKPSTAWNQRIVTSYDPDTGEFDPNKFVEIHKDKRGQLASVSSPPSEIQCISYLDAARAGKVNYRSLVDNLPTVSQDTFIKGFRERFLHPIKDPRLYAKSEEYKAFCWLLGHNIDENIPPPARIEDGAIQNFYNTSGRDMLGVVFRLQDAGFADPVVLNLASQLYGWVRVRTLVGLTHLNQTAGQHPNTWRRTITGGGFDKRWFSLSKTEWNEMLSTRKTMGLPDPVLAKPAAAEEKVPQLPKEKANRPQISVGAETDVGIVRRADPNEDTFFLRDSGLAGGEGRLRLMVGDGMGGHASGEVASGMLRKQFEDASPGTDIVRIIKEANQAVYQATEHIFEYKGMGSTVVAADISKDKASGQLKAQISWAGDSRAYLIRGNDIRPLTNDHSWVQEEVDQGALTPEQARKHPRRAIITRAVGSSPNIQVDTISETLQPGDRLLLSSDGLHDQVPDVEICHIITSSHSPQTAVQELIKRANQKGGLDNVTALVVQF